MTKTFKIGESCVGGKVTVNFSVDGGITMHICNYYTDKILFTHVCETPDELERLLHFEYTSHFYSKKVADYVRTKQL